MDGWRASIERFCLPDRYMTALDATLKGVHFDVFRSLTLMKLRHIRAGSLLSRISQRTLVTTSPKGIGLASDAGGWWDHSPTAEIATTISTLWAFL